MKYTILSIIFGLVISACSNAQNSKSSVPCQEGINLLPLYGNVEKCPDLKEADQRFLDNCDKTYPSRKEAAKAHVQMAWRYAEKGDRDTATKRFNQAWLLDDTNADLYWGLGIIQASKHLYEESENLFNKSLELNPNNERVMYCLAVNIKEQHAGNDTPELTEKRIELLKKAIDINPRFVEAIQLLMSESGESLPTLEHIKKEDKKETYEYSDGSSIEIKRP